MIANTKTPISVEFIGNYDLVTPADTFVLDSDSNYVKGCHAFAAGSVQRVWVSHRNHFQWLAAFCSRTGITANFAEKTPRSLLADAWKVSLPPWLTEEIVMDEDLLQRAKPSLGSGSFIDGILSLFLGESLTAPDLGPSQVDAIVSSIANQGNWNVASDRSLIKSCLQDKCNEWKRRAHSNWEANFADALLEDPQGLWRDLSILALLRGYPEKLTEYLLAKERLEAFRGLPVEALKKIPLQSGAVELATGQIELFFHDVVPEMKKREHLVSLIGCLSGRLFREFQLVEQTLEQAQFDLSLEDFEATRKVFEDCQGVSTSRLVALKKFMKPARPECTPAAGSWDTSDWLKWSKDYLPFRQWQSATGTSDTNVEGMVQRFSDWYVREYTAVHHDGALSLVHVMTGWQSSILRDELSVIVVADCVPVDFWDNLKTCLSRSGFSRHAEDYRFAPLPTETAVSKPMMIAGQWDLISKPYNILLEMRSKTDWGGRNVRYFGDLKDLAACHFDREPIILLLNFLPPDDLLHSDVSQINSTYEEEVNRVFARLAESLREVVEKWPGPKDRVGLYVATDHGATKILAIETKSLESKVVTKLFSSPKYRFAEVPDTEADNIPENLWELGYRFKQPFADKSATYFIPKGHNTVASGSLKGGFMHGGATPEEVIVAAGSFRLSKPAWKTPAARFLDLRLDNGVAVFYVQRLNTISMAIQNPNRELLTVRDIRILTTGSEVRKCSRPTVTAESEEVLSIECLFRPESKAQVEFNVQIEYSISGEEQSISLAVKAAFKSAQTGGFQLKDLV